MRGSTGGQAPQCIDPGRRLHIRAVGKMGFPGRLRLRERRDATGGESRAGPTVKVTRRRGGQTGIATKTRPKTKKPSLYKVLLLNDDYTPMEFVVHVLERFFNKGREEATRIMLHVHQQGVGICGVYTYEVAETKVAQVMDFSRQNQHPLQCTMEKE